MATPVPVPGPAAIRTAVQAVEAHRALLGDDVASTLLTVLQAVRPPPETSGEQTPTQQLKLVSVLFLDMVGSTALSAHLDPEDVHIVMDGALAAYSALVASHGGRVLQYAGDNLLAVFGAPVAREDDAERAVLAGLALLAEAQVQQRRLQELVPHLEGEVTFAVRVGIHTGDVLLGGGVDGDGTIRGQTVNLAARMEQTAPVGGLRISQATWRFVRGRFDMVEQPPLSIKGHAEPVQTHLVRGVAGRAAQALRGVDGVATRFLGRGEELAALHALIDQLCRRADTVPQASPRPALAPASRQQRILVVGEPGQGKTRLCAELLHRSIRRHGAALAWAGVQADTTMQATPYAVLRRLLTTLLARAASPASVSETSPAHAAQVDATAQTWLELCIGVLDTPADAAVLGHLLGYNFSSHPDVLALADDARRLRDRALHHLGQAVGVLASNRAWVLWLDDLQWADAASLHALGNVMQRQPELAVLWLCSTRPEGLGRWPELEPDASDVHGLTLTGLAAHDQRRLAIHLLTGG